jgi:hypothetical protein
VAEAVEGRDLRDGNIACALQEHFPCGRQPEPTQITERGKFDERTEMLAQRSFANLADSDEVGHRNFAMHVLSHVVDGFFDVGGRRPAVLAHNTIDASRWRHQR